ncbi:MAG: hypothetical protein V7L05_23005 [Nostoc sp.]|uniref:hypothetical protein n=1 Tax=Nostoc sp. TaxID=1180 RepID=UPI002FF84FEA
MTIFAENSFKTRTLGTKVFSIGDRPTALLLKETLRERASYGRRWRWRSLS